MDVYEVLVHTAWWNEITEEVHVHRMTLNTAREVGFSSTTEAP